MQLGRGEVSVLPQQCFLMLIDQTPEETGARAGKRKERLLETKILLLDFHLKSHLCDIFFSGGEHPRQEGISKC